MDARFNWEPVILMRDMLPTCAKCGKPVDHLRQHTDPNTDAMIFKAHCHGAVDRTIITAKDQMEWGLHRLIPDVAFRKDALRVDVTC